MNSPHPKAAQALRQLNIELLNPMQEAAIAAIDAGTDLVLLSPTGSGKTLAYLLPLLPRLQPGHSCVQALVLVPSRELALQIEDVFKKMQTGFKVNCCYGGHNIQTEINNLSEPPALLIGTPGRVIDHIDRGTLGLDQVHTVVLDEFDKSLEFGFQPQMEYAIAKMPALKQRILTSATDLAQVPGFVGLNAPQRLNFLSERGTVEKLEIRKVVSPEADKLETLLQLICKLGEQAMLVFLNHRDAVERVSQFLDEQGVLHDYFHGGLDQNMRERTLTKFRNGSCRILVTTDLAARGLDIPEIAAVVHYHLPLTEDAFTHRNGRTARMHAEGAAYVIVGPGEKWPAYIDQDVPTEELPANVQLPQQPAWATLYISKGKKAKINKIDIVGFLSKKGGLSQEDLGLIMVKDECAYVAVKRDKIQEVIRQTKTEKLKGIKVLIEVAK
ncbi:MAG TPA: DEAD/DEAH box helicase [Bacteroidia bacterium]|nr:DEAD/DEAH box helicase [Bacteroidia bacterium]